MNELRFATDVLEKIRRRGDRYDERAYLFLLPASSTSRPGCRSGAM